MSTFWKFGYKTVFRTRAEAERLARDRCGTHVENISGQLATIEPVEIDGEPLYQSRDVYRWSLLSDCKIRHLVLAELHHPECWQGGPLEGLISDRVIRIENSPMRPGASSFLAAILGADGGRLPAWAVQLRDAVEGVPVVDGPSRGHYAHRTVTPWSLLFVDGTQRTVWVFSVGYFEGYAFEVFETQGEAIRAALT